MQFDRYTKIVLTVIALSLSIIAAEMSIPTANAQKYGNSGVQMVAICNIDSTYNGSVKCADILHNSVTGLDSVAVSAK